MTQNEAAATRQSVFTCAAATRATEFGCSTVGTATTSETPPGDEPILLVHGFLDTGETPWWTVLIGYLQNIGYSKNEIYVLNLGSIPLTTVNSPKVYANEVEARLKRISDRHESEVDIIAHSMGGLDSRWAVEKQGAAQYVDDLVTLGTPHQGTYVAYLSMLTKGGRDMIPGSPFLTQLNDGHLAEAVSYTAIWSYGDGLILPGKYAMLPPSMRDSTAVTRNINTGYEQHFELVSDCDVFARYYEFLD